MQQQQWTPYNYVSMCGKPEQALNYIQQNLNGDCQNDLQSSDLNLN